MKINTFNKILKLYKKSNIQKVLKDKMEKDYAFKENSYDPIRSLFLKHKNVNDYSYSQILRKNLDHILADNDKNQLSAEQNNYEEIDKEADIKLDEIAKSNISREQLLGINRKGPAIKSNPFFNLIRCNPDLRKSYLNNRATYTVQNIIELAIRQDVGYDDISSAIGKKVVLPYEDEKDPLKKRYSRQVYLENDIIKESDSSDYFTTRQQISEKDYNDTNVMDNYKPIEKIDHFKKDIHIAKEQIHWRNTPLLAQFLSIYGNIKHRKYTRLDYVTHRRIVKAIKKARKLRLLPTFSYLKSYHKKPLKTLEEDMENEINMEVDLDSGMICRRVQEPEIDFTESRNYFKHTLMYFDTINAANKTEDDQELFEDATNYAMIEKKEEMLKKNMKYYNEIIYTETLPRFKDLDNLDSTSLKESYDKLQDKVKDISYQDFLYLLISEHTQNYDMLQNIIDVSNSVKEAQQDVSNETYKDLLDQLETIKSEYMEDKQNVNKKEVDFLMRLYLDEFNKNNQLQS